MALRTASAKRKIMGAIRAFLHRPSPRTDAEERELQIRTGREITDLLDAQGWPASEDAQRWYSSVSAHSLNGNGTEHELKEPPRL
jgi:hypothetical protein